MIALSIALVVVAGLAWDGWRRHLEQRRLVSASDARCAALETAHVEHAREIAELKQRLGRIETKTVMLRRA